jgi:hypothetical protein
VEIMQKLISKWEIDKISGLTDEAEKHVIIWWNCLREWLEFLKESLFLKKLIYLNGWSLHDCKFIKRSNNTKCWFSKWKLLKSTFF